MLGKILMKLGLIKEPTETVFKYIFYLNEKFAKHCLSDLDLEASVNRKAQVEIKVFFWGYVQPEIRKKLSPGRLKELSMFYQDQVLFSSLTEEELANVDEDIFLAERFKFHSRGIPYLSRPIPGDPYLTTLSKLWFEAPFLNVKYEDEAIRNGIFEGFTGSSTTQARALHLIKHKGPNYKKGLMLIIKNWKK